MTRPPSPQFVETEQGWSWTWRTTEGLPDPVTGHAVEREVELEWLTAKEVWKVRSRIDRAGWGPTLVVSDLDEPESQTHADELAREYAFRPRGGEG